MPSQAYFSPELFRFLRQLKRNNRREWFLKNKERYDTVVREASLRFILDLNGPLQQVSPYLVSDPRPSGGSLFRIYRDVRFSSDKKPYKTHIGMHFSHRVPGKDAHTPGFYLHLEPGGCLVAGGSWRPDPHALLRIRQAIAADPKGWKAATRGLQVDGDTLARPPRGFDPLHPCIVDLKHKDFYASLDFTDAQVCSTRFLPDFLRACRRLSPLLGFLSRAVGLRY